MTITQGLEWLLSCRVATPFPEIAADMPPIKRAEAWTEPHIALLAPSIKSSELYRGLDSYRIFLDKYNRPVLWVWDFSPHRIDLIEAWMNDHSMWWRIGTWHIEYPPMAISNWIKEQRT